MDEPRLSKDRPLVVGMIRGGGRPGNNIVANAHAAAMLNAKLIYFTPEDVDVKNKKVKALHYAEGQWHSAVCDFPDVIENDERSLRKKEVFAAITENAPFTMHSLGGKLTTFNRLKKSGLYGNLLIPDYSINSLSDFTGAVTSFEKFVVKPMRGSRGNQVSYFERTSKGFNVNHSGTTSTLNMADLAGFYNEHISSKQYLLQNYIESRSRHGLPFDIRIHVRRGYGARWRLVKMYARIGAGDSIVSNISAGGSIAAANTFLRTQFGEVKGRQILSELKELANTFPDKFQSLYPEFMIDALGIDIGIDRDGKLWIFEINSFPGATFFELTAAIPRMEYAVWLARDYIQCRQNKPGSVALCVNGA
ncbi:YheC/YheD family protein [Leclercia adecarboxylata]|uniref:YheC/YheD family protein n=1 Tax=Leclercia adecarboxylata TaxID=83655 RepID=UPI002DB7803B|nr:YheC/YheD family protein [Leclercia adecarboxylata]MEB6380380.1 YheC/YheD family protein [Leclercia adecarboxylata]